MDRTECDDLDSVWTRLNVMIWTQCGPDSVRLSGLSVDRTQSDLDSV